MCLRATECEYIGGVQVAQDKIQSRIFLNTVEIAQSV
jgi:hypothetical protein